MKATAETQAVGVSGAPFPLEYPASLRPYQEEAAAAIIESVWQRLGLTFTVVMARQAGKNELSARVERALLVAYSHRRIDAVKCAPTFEPQARISLRRLWRLIVADGFGALAAIEDGRAIRLSRARELFLSADSAANIVGHTAGLLLEVDEAQDVEREKFDREFRPMAAPTGATIVYYGTPWDDSTLLAQASEANLENERRDGIRRHFTADWTEVARCNPAYGRFVENERQRLGEEHPLFRTQYALKPVSGNGRLFNGAQQAQLQGPHSRQHQPVAGEMYVAGLDVGGQEFGGPALAGRGHDATVLTIARVVAAATDAVIQEPRLEVVEHVAVTGEAHDALFARLADALNRVWRVRRLAVDATGLGETLAGLLRRALGNERVVAVRFTAESKSQLGYGLMVAVNGGRLKLYAPDGSEEYRELCRQAELARVSYSPRRTMNFFVDPSAGHDDYLVSLALAVKAADGMQMASRIARGRLREVSTVLN